MPIHRNFMLVVCCVVALLILQGCTVIVRHEPPQDNTGQVNQIGCDVPALEELISLPPLMLETYRERGDVNGAIKALIIRNDTYAELGKAAEVEYDLCNQEQ